MKYTIEGLQQEKLVAWRYDATDAIIIRFILDFYNTNKMKKIEIEGKCYFWLHYQTILTELPIININKRSLSDRMMKMCGRFKESRRKGMNKHALFEFHLNKNAQGTFTYFRFKESELEQLLTNPVKCKLRPKEVQTAVGDVNQTIMGGAGQLTTKDSSTRSNTSHNSNSSPRRRQSAGLPPSKIIQAEEPGPSEEELLDIVAHLNSYLPEDYEFEKPPFAKRERRVLFELYTSGTLDMYLMWYMDEKYYKGFDWGLFLSQSMISEYTAKVK